MTEALKMYMDKYSLVSIRVTNSRKIELPFSNSPRPREKHKNTRPPFTRRPPKKIQPCSQPPRKLEKLYTTYENIWTQNFKPAVKILLARNQILSAIDCQCAIFHIKTMAINTFFAEYKQITMRVFCLYIRKMSVVPVYRPFPYNVLAYFLDGQVYKKEIKLEIMTNVFKSHLYKHAQQK